MVGCGPLLAPLLPDAPGGSPQLVLRPTQVREVDTRLWPWPFLGRPVFHPTTSGMTSQVMAALELAGPPLQRPRRMGKAQKLSGLWRERERRGLWLSGSPQGVRLSISPPGWGEEPEAAHMNADSPVRAGQNYKLSCPSEAFSCRVLGQGLGEGLLCGPTSLNLLQWKMEEAAACGISAAGGKIPASQGSPTPFTGLTAHSRGHAFHFVRGLTAGVLGKET